MLEIYTDGSAHPNPGPGGFGVIVLDKDKNFVRVPVRDSEINLLTNALAECDVVSFEQEPYTLEEYFMGFYKEDKNYGGQL